MPSYSSLAQVIQYNFPEMQLVPSRLHLPFTATHPSPQPSLVAEVGNANDHEGDGLLLFCAKFLLNISLLYTFLLEIFPESLVL